MRQIKFRAWDGEEMLKDWLVLKDTGGGVFPVTLTRKAGVVMQFTGLKDKNGKDVYEADIIKRFEEDDKPELVIWGDFNCRAWNDKDIEVIGNIYENPELLVQLDK